MKSMQKKLKKLELKRSFSAHKKGLIIALIVFGGILLAAAVAYVVFRLLTPDYLEDFEDDNEEDFEDDYFETAETENK